MSLKDYSNLSYINNLDKILDSKSKFLYPHSNGHILTINICQFGLIFNSIYLFSFIVHHNHQTKSRPKTEEPKTEGFLLYM